MRTLALTVTLVALASSSVSAQTIGGGGAPQLNVTSPTVGFTYDAGTATSVVFSGTGKNLTSCTYTNSLGGSGSASLALSGSTLTWTMGSVSLSVGENLVTVTCGNGAGGTVVRGIYVTRSAAGADCTVTTADAEEGTIQAQIDALAEGSVICVPGGDVTWTTAVTVPSTKGMTIRGNGIGSTIVHWTQGAAAFHLLLGTDGRAVTDVSGFTIDMDLSETANNAAFDIEATATNANAFRVHHNEIKDLVLRGMKTYAAGFAFSGLIDNNIVRCPQAGSCHAIEPTGNSFDEAGASVPFARGLDLGGSSDYIFIEDNLLEATVANDGCLDAYNGAKFVFRFNTCANNRFGWHGVDSSLRGIHSFEVYRNAFTNNAGGLAGADERSGVGMVFENTYTGDWTPQLLKVARAGDSGTPYANECDGTAMKDGNEGATGVPGWPCLDQTGTLFNEPRDGTHTHYGNYYWQNTDDGVYFGALVGYDADSVIEGRDFRNGTAGPQTTSSSPFDGTSGIGWGTLANRPTTCTPTSGHTVIGVGYWAADQGIWNTESAALHATHTAGNHAQGEAGVFYFCDSTNHWTTTPYTPHPYPHELRN